MTQLGFFSTRDYLALPHAPQHWIVEPLLPVGGTLNIFGGEKTGKSVAAQQMAHAIAGTEGDWLGFPIQTHGLVCYLQLDTPRTLWRARILEYQHAGLNVLGHPHGIHYADRETAPHPFNILQHWSWLREWTTKLTPLVVIIDVIREIHDADEDKSSQMKPIISALTEAVSPAALVILSHTRKTDFKLAPSDRDAAALQENRGSNYLGGRVDGAVRLSYSPRKREGTLVYRSRTTPQKSFHLHAQSTGPETFIWTPATAELATHITAVLADPSLTSDRARARALAGRIDRSEQACRHLLRRHHEPGPPEEWSKTGGPPSDHP